MNQIAETGTNPLKLTCVILLVEIAGFAVCLHAQSPAPVATYTVNVPGAMKQVGDHRFVWTLAPDNSLIILLAQPHGLWTIKRLIDWQTATPKDQTAAFADALPDRERNLDTWFDEPLIDPQGKYIVVHRRAVRRRVQALGDPYAASLLAVLDLHTLNLVYRGQGLHLRGDFSFLSGGILLRRSWTRNERFVSRATLLFLPTPDHPMAVCDYNDKILRESTGRYVEAEGPSCPAFLRAAHVSSIDELSSSPIPPTGLQDVPGPNRYCADIHRTQKRVLIRCGNVHFADRAGDFFIVFWKTLAVLSLPEGKLEFSVPLAWNDTESSGLLAQVGGSEYLIVRHGLELRSYRVP